MGEDPISGCIVSQRTLAVSQVHPVLLMASVAGSPPQVAVIAPQLMVTLPKTCDEIAHPRLPVQDRNGASYCYNCVIEAFQAKGYNLACRMLRDWAMAEDVMQESFVSGYRAFAQFRGVNLNAWMMRIIANTCRDFLRSRRALPFISLDPMPTASDDPTPSAVDLPGREESPEEYAEREELRRAIISGLDCLPEERRLAVVLVDVQGLSYEEAAQVMNCSTGTVKPRISRGRAALRDYLRATGELLPSRFRQDN